MGIRFYNLNGFFVKKLAHGVKYFAGFHFVPPEAEPSVISFVAPALFDFSQMNRHAVTHGFMGAPGAELLSREEYLWVPLFI